MKLKAPKNRMLGLRCHQCQSLIMPGQDYFLYPSDMKHPFQEGIGDSSNQVICNKCNNKNIKENECLH